MSKTKTKKCKECSEKFEAKIRELNRGNGKFCSLSCANSYNNRKRRKPRIEVNCAYCEEPFEIPEYKFENSKNRIFFCCRDHKDKGQRIEAGIEEIQPNHYNNGDSSYRNKALNEQQKPYHCSECERNLPKPVLEVHHIDENHENNKLENLKVVCPTCHRLEHYKRKTGRYSN